MDQKVLNKFKAAHQISMSTNQIERIATLDLSNLKILSLGRNNIRSMQGLGGVPNLEELWISYNEIEKLNGIECLQKLQVLYMSNNKISDINELETLKMLSELNDIVFKGNKFYEDREPQEIRNEILRILPIKGGKLDGDLITASDIQASLAVEEEVAEN